MKKINYLRYVGIFMLTFILRATVVAQTPPLLGNDEPLFIPGEDSINILSINPAQKPTDNFLSAVKNSTAKYQAMGEKLMNTLRSIPKQKKVHQPQIAPDFKTIRGKCSYDGASFSKFDVTAMPDETVMWNMSGQRCFKYQVSSPGIYIYEKKLSIEEQEILVKQHRSSGQLLWGVPFDSYPQQFQDTVNMYIEYMRDQYFVNCGDTFRFQESIRPISQGGLLQPERPVGTAHDSMFALRARLAFCTTREDTLHECLRFAYNNHLKGSNELIPDGTSTVSWTYSFWHKRFVVHKDTAGNCGVYTPHFAKALQLGAGIRARHVAIYSAGNSMGGHTFLLVQSADGTEWHVADPMVCGLWKMDGQLGNLETMMTFLRNDPTMQRFHRITFDDRALPPYLSMIIDPLGLWGAWSFMNTAQCGIELYDTHTDHVEPMYGDSTTELLYFVAGIPYAPTRHFYELRAFGGRMVPDGEGSQRYYNDEGDEMNWGMSSMFEQSGQPIHFSSLFLIREDTSQIVYPNNYPYTPSITCKPIQWNYLNSIFH